VSETTLTRKVALNATALAAGRVASVCLGLVSVGISTRYLGLHGYGELATAIAFAALVNVVADIGIWSIAAREIAKRPEETQRIISGVITAGLVLSLGAAAVGVIAAFAIYPGNGNEPIRRAILLLLVTLPFAAPYGAVSAYFIANQRAYMGMLTSVIGSVVTLIMLIVVTALDGGFTGVVVAYVTAAAAQAVVMIALSAGKISIRPSTDLALSRQLLGWALPLGGAMFIHGIYWRIDLILLSLLSTYSEVGLYALVYRLVDALVTLPGFVTITLLPEFARLTERPARFDEIVEKALRVIRIGAVAVFVTFFVFADEITDLVGGSDFAGAAPVLRLLMGGVALTYVGSIFGQAIFALNGQRKLLTLTAVLLPANVALNLVLIPPWGASGAALAFTLTEIVHLAGLAFIYRGFATLPHPRRGGRLLVAAGVSATAVVVKLLPLGGQGGLILKLVLGTVLALALYVAALYALDAMPREIHANLVLPVRTRLRALWAGGLRG
jgi:O-antigen/teichoic acid export membrane protein